MGWLLDLHSVWRYAVIITLLDALAFALLAYLGSREWDNLADKMALVYTIAMDIQVLIGGLVWIFVSPRSDNFLTWVHPGLMLAAAGLAHAGKGVAERTEGSKAKGGKALLFFGASLIVVLIAIPLASWPL